MDESTKQFLKNLANEPMNARARRRLMEREIKKWMKKQKNNDAS
jgi:hypothetical protein